MVELEAQPQQQPALEDAGREVRVTGFAADCAEQDRILATDLGQHRVGKHLAGCQITLGAQVVGSGVELRLGADCFCEHFEGLGGHFTADAVAGNHGKLKRLCHG